MPEQTEIQENPPELDGCPDMSALIYLEEPNVIHNLKIRFERQTVYTRIAKILISINPYEWLPIYSNDNIKRYEENSLLDVPDSSIDPHCYNMAAIAYNDMNSESKSQSLIVCGESGSGKTESAKALMSFLAKTKTESDSSENLSEAVLAVNPILVCTTFK
ncbi:Unconventional myosin-XVI [Bonamia ostreae]|uniref:Unconventional myosin-XVI n=1 Tax=Bonamia ostreae TaxID=126728 RepID=A0ABV2AU25_9EUKA